MSIHTGSRYTHTETYYPKGSGRKVFNIRERANVSLKDAKYHTWVSSDTLDYIAYKEYGDSKFWWIILDANPQYQHELDIKVGDLVAIPPFNEVVKHI